MPKFKQNDWVSFAGQRGVVVTLKGSNPEAPLQVMFPDQKAVRGFTLDGRFGGKVKVLDKPIDWFVVDRVKLVKRPRVTILQRIKNWWKSSGAKDGNTKSNTP